MGEVAQVWHYAFAGLGLGLVVIGAGLGIGKLAAGVAEGVARQPSAAGEGFDRGRVQGTWMDVEIAFGVHAPTAREVTTNRFLER